MQTTLELYVQLALDTRSGTGLVFFLKFLVNQENTLAQGFQILDGVLSHQKNKILGKTKFGKKQKVLRIASQTLVPNNFH